MTYIQVRNFNNYIIRSTTERTSILGIISSTAHCKFIGETRGETISNAKKYIIHFESLSIPAHMSQIYLTSTSCLLTNYEYTILFQHLISDAVYIKKKQPRALPVPRRFAATLIKSHILIIYTYSNYEIDDIARQPIIARLGDIRSRPRLYRHSGRAVIPLLRISRSFSLILPGCMLRNDIRPFFSKLSRTQVRFSFQESEEARG